MLNFSGKGTGITNMKSRHTGYPVMSIERNNSKRSMTKRTSILWVIASVVFSLAVLSVFISESFQETITAFVRFHKILGPLAVMLLRFSTVILAPLPGSTVAFASLAVLPWWQALIYNFIGVQSGIIVAFFIARKFREPAVRHFVSLQQVHEWQDRITK